VASHEGLGRLPAKVVSNILFPSRFYFLSFYFLSLPANSSSARVSGGST
jgi:hypothetical protein